MTTKKGLSIIIPAYNEEDRISATILQVQAYCRERNIFHQVLVVNDGSTDDTLKKLYSGGMHSTKNLYFCSYKQNRGKGYAVRKGLKEAKYKTCLIIDADHSVEIRELDKFFMMCKSYEIFLKPFIYGQRKQVEKQPLYRIVAGKVFKILTYLATGIFADTQCLSKNTLMFCRRKGIISIKSVEELYQSKDNYEAYSLKNGFVKIKKIIRKRSKGYIHKIKTKSGKKISVTKEHPFLTNNGAVRAENLNESHCLASVGKLIYKTKNQYINLIKQFEKNEIYKVKKGKFRLKNGRIWVTKKVIINEDIARLLGLFTAEGNISIGRGFNLRWCLSSDEQKYIDFVKKTLMKYFNLDAKVRVDGKSVVISTYSKALWLWFYNNKFAHNKFGDIIFSLNENLRWAFIDGYFAGDGCVHKLKNCKSSVVISATSSQKRLITKLNYLLMSLGIGCSISGSKRKCNITFKRKGLVVYRNDNRINVLSGFKNDFLKRTPFFLFKYSFGNTKIYEQRETSNIHKITENNKKKYNDYVYDVTLNSPDYFLAGNGVFIHNCPFKILNMPKEFYDELTIDGFAYDVELFMKLKAKGITGESMQVNYYNDERSKVTLKKTIQMARDIWKIRKDCKKL